MLVVNCWMISSVVKVKIMVSGSVDFHAIEKLFVHIRDDCPIALKQIALELSRRPT